MGGTDSGFYGWLRLYEYCVSHGFHILCFQRRETHTHIHTHAHTTANERKSTNLMTNKRQQSWKTFQRLTRDRVREEHARRTASVYFETARSRRPYPRSRPVERWSGGHVASVRFSHEQRLTVAMARQNCATSSTNAG